MRENLRLLKVCLLHCHTEIWEHNNEIFQREFPFKSPAGDALAMSSLLLAAEPFQY